MTKGKEGETPANLRDAVRSAARDGNVNLTNMLLWDCDLPVADKYGVLAIAYETQAQVRDDTSRHADSEAERAYLIPAWQLEKIGLKAIARHLRELEASARARSSLKTHPK